jgi:hypothetical protein
MKMAKIVFETILRKYNIPSKNGHYLNDFIFLQEKNKEYCLGEKKTKKLFEEYKSMKGIIDHLGDIKNKRTLATIKFQKQKIEYYLVIKSLFLSKEDIINE